MESDFPSSEEIALEYVEQLPFAPYPFQEQAIFSWFDSEDGILVCAPTGTGKTVIAETALYEAIRTGRKAYYTTPLIALTEQKFYELQDSVEHWGYSKEDVGLVTGNRRINPDAKILVVVAEILLNRLLSPEDFPFDDTAAVVMDEFHSFNDPERGIVWELSLGMLPANVKVLLISATVGNAPEFVVWLAKNHQRTLRLLQSDERKVPLSFRWVIDQLLPEQLEIMAAGDDDSGRYTPSLVFCFNRGECWNIADQLKGRQLLTANQKKELHYEIDQLDWDGGAGGKLKQILIRGIGIHHAGLLPRYRRAIESLFQKKLLSICVCTETLAAGINLPARSVVMTSLLKGPPRALKLIDASSAQQMFGRAGRPQFDSHGYVFAVAHEDDVKLHRWQEKYDQIPEDTKDAGLRRAKKNLKKKMPKRKTGQQYWTEKQLEQLRTASAGNLSSRGRIPWRLLAYLIRKSGSVMLLEHTIRKRLLNSAEMEDALKNLKRMLVTLDAAGFVKLSPPPPHRLADQSDAKSDSLADASVDVAKDETEGDADVVFRSVAAGRAVDLAVDEVQAGRTVKTSVWGGGTELQDEGLGEIKEFSSTDEDFSDFGSGIDEAESTTETSKDAATESQLSTSEVTNDISEPEAEKVQEPEPEEEEGPAPATAGLFGQLIQEARESGGTASTTSKVKKKSVERSKKPAAEYSRLDHYEPENAMATDSMDLLFAFRSVNSIYALFLAEHFGQASYEERLQLLEGALDMPRSVARFVKVPFPDKMPPGPLSTEFADSALLKRGLATQDELNGYYDEINERRIPPLMLADKIHLMFRADFPGIHDARCTPVWCVGDLLKFNGDFNKYVKTRDLVKQEGIIFRHCLRMILLCGEYAQIEPPGIPAEEWQNDLSELAALLTDSCRAVDPASTDETLNQLESRLNEDEKLVV